ncbi:hypothetical protein TBLA_0I01440 [Henningerozyma blattae CBS 6284]|uniref:HTH TFE/IIEalpha-type domain-containing protein n=1 Tax=Henningerozyma blattae (strain ATCC 34711 / CBS 6284 / DSM 70876 / NBRC 10599 / NRRL Y-10934 / UCD 77-7) TaxID=1071380 RepID=I2H8V1_HENB6|nr:hypothetical protein TBLA_0I01440 [Tetrapisispora blattae CBS 6284]CCH62803.1 hypothetical protein TBLA_0I01440 [Tetrapisispora blattae CBS 6284]
MDNRPIEDIVKNLLKFVVRGFYGGSFVLVLDAILFHSVLAEEDLKQLLGINKTDLGPLVARLRSDGLLSTHKQREYPPNSKSVERVYFYIKYPHAIDAIKWKVHQVVQRLKDDLDKNSAPNGYMCPICETKYTQLEAVQLLNYDRTEFLCSLCDEPLIEDDSGKKNKEKQDKLNKLMDQVQPIIDSLKKIDDSRIEENTFEIALARLIPPQNQSRAAYTYNPKKGSTMFRPGESNLANIMGTSLGNESSRRAGANSQATLHINITTASDEVAQRELQERQAEEKRKQNAVPEWHKQSTIGKTALGRLDEDEEFDPRTTQQAAMSLGQPMGSERNDMYHHRVLTEKELEERDNERSLNEYYASLAKKQQKASQENMDENDINDEDDDESEEVLIDFGETANNLKEEDEEDEMAEAEFEDEFEDVLDEKQTNSQQVIPKSENVEESASVNNIPKQNNNSEEHTNNNNDDDDDDMDIEFEDV